ncbi:LacI family DNA-binding transcriptional regulator [uncultured Friedmanniella sp.]|uniref:LacI family DNA-binding transcriptional regulator n=1 Tax=uncultured Friedmanniella sp. TaxID=335381 RepID=UPI0035CADED0
MTAVAAAAGVSLTTVSHVMNGTRRVDEGTRRKVREAAESLGYAHLRGPRQPRSEAVIGVIVPSAASPYFGEMLEGIDTEATRADITLLLGLSDEDPDREYAAVRTLLHREVDAIILVPSAGWRRRTRPLLKDSSATVILVDRLDDRTFDQVGSENAVASETVVGHLIALGHRRIGLIGGLAGITTTHEREAGYRLAHEREGLEVDERLVREGLSTVRGGFSAAVDLLGSRERPSAVFCANNNMTIGLLEALRKSQLRAPEDLAFVTFDDLEWSDVVTPTITSVAQPFHAIGSMAVQLSLQRLMDPGGAVRTVRFPSSIEHRESCGCVPTAAILDR